MKNSKQNDNKIIFKIIMKKFINKIENKIMMFIYKINLYIK